MDYHACLNNNFNGLFSKKFGEPRNINEEITDHHKNIAASAQSAFEEIVIVYLNYQNKTGSENLCIVGGCGLNCTANGKVLENKIFKNVYVPPAPNDAGGSLEAILEQKKYISFENLKKNIILLIYQGPKFKLNNIENILKKFQNKIYYNKIDEKEKFLSLCKKYC